MSERCLSCGREQETDMWTLTDDSGGSAVRLCSDCRAIVVTARCAFCGQLKLGRHKAGILCYVDESETGDERRKAVEVCDTCRRELLFGREVAI